MTDMDQNKTHCEQEHGTEHLPADLRSRIYRKAYEDGHANGFDEVVNCYADFADVALAAFNMGAEFAASAAREEQRNIVCRYLKKESRSFRSDLDKGAPL